MAILAAILPAAPAGGQGATVISYSVRDARAYAYRVSLSPQVIEAAGLQDRFAPCDPQEDPYHCDQTEYEHEPNCPPGIALGRTEPGPAPRTAPDVAELRGGAGDELGAPDRPPLASPITLNEQLSLASMSRLGAVVEAAGLSSASYVDLSGRQEPTMHTESDAFVRNRAQYEERCVPDDATEEEHAHYLSRSFETPETYHLAECREGECPFGGAAIGAEAEEARTIVHLYERAGALHGLLHASLHDAEWGGGVLTADLLDTTLTFSTDGTAGGLEYSVRTTAAGVRFSGIPITLPPGEPAALPGVQIGVAAPYVSAPSTGRSLDVVAPGLFIATTTQTVLFGGVELSATMGRQSPPAGFGDDDDVATGDQDVDGSVLPPAAPVGSPPAPSPPAPEEPAEPELAVSRVATGGWVTAMAIAAGLIAALLMLTRWIGRYPWGRRLHRVQPLRAIDWVYRAFVRT